MLLMISALLNQKTHLTHCSSGKKNFPYPTILIKALFIQNKYTPTLKGRCFSLNKI